MSRVNGAAAALAIAWLLAGGCGEARSPSPPPLEQLDAPHDWPDAPLGPVRPAEDADDELTRLDAEVLSVVLENLLADPPTFFARPVDEEDESRNIFFVEESNQLYKGSDLEDALFRADAHHPQPQSEPHRHAIQRNAESLPMRDLVLDEPFVFATSGDMGAFYKEHVLRGPGSWPARYHISVARPGYTEFRDYALVYLTFGPTPHGAIGMYWLRRTESGWDIVWRVLMFFA